jgi:hypothetical protein
MYFVLLSGIGRTARGRGAAGTARTAGRARRRRRSRARGTHRSEGRAGSGRFAGAARTPGSARSTVPLQSTVKVFRCEYIHQWRVFLATLLFSSDVELWDCVTRLTLRLIFNPLCVCMSQVLQDVATQKEV